MNSFDRLQQRLQISFCRLELLKTALIHRSYLNEHKEIEESNERLEFLGDAVLELVVSEFLYRHYPKKLEGELTGLRAKIVQTKTLARVAKNLRLPLYLQMSKGEAESGGRDNESLLADGFEALIGAVFLDQGIENAALFIKKHLLASLEEILTSEETVDYKSFFQELVQAQKQPTPEYRIVAESGPDHHKVFTAAVSVAGKQVALGRGRTKQVAEQQAAKLALEKFKRKE